jgi:outer membrane lipopolysaccharide assembly protein LptE/RlpB
VLLLGVAAVAGLGGCGYAFRPSSLPPHIHTIAIPVFRNHTSEPAVDSTLTRAVVEAFSTDGRLRVVRVEQADSVLDGEVTAYRVESIAYDAQANVRRFRLVVTLNLTLRDVQRGEVLLDQRGVTEQADFQVAGGVSETIVREDSALRAAATDIARAVVSFTVQRF